MFKRLVSVVKMGPCLRVYYPRAAFCCTFLWAEELIEKDVFKGRFYVYGEKCSSRKAVHNWMVNASLMMRRLKRRCGSG
jgi:hypothetical protein